MEGSGREAGVMATDSDWMVAPSPMILPEDDETIRTFISHDLSDIPATQLIHLAKIIHKEYQTGQIKKCKPKEPSNHDWDDLNPELQQSNIEFVCNMIVKG